MKSYDRMNEVEKLTEDIKGYIFLFFILACCLIFTIGTYIGLCQPQIVDGIRYMHLGEVFRPEKKTLRHVSTLQRVSI